MFIKIFILELKKNLQSPAFYIFFLIFLVGSLIFTLTTDPHTQFMGVAHGKEWHNAPLKIAQILNRYSVLGLLFTMVLVGRAVVKDFEANIHELIFSKPLTKFNYLAGRFFGSLFANLLLFIGIILGFEIGLAFLALFCVVVVPPLMADGDILGAFAAGFVNPYASGYSSDVIACWLILAVWVAFEATSKSVKHGWICVLLGVMPGVAVGLAAYLVLRSNQLAEH